MGNKISDRDDSLKSAKKFALIAAEELGYPEEIFNKIEKAKNDIQIAQIMAYARKIYL